MLILFTSAIFCITKFATYRYLNVIDRYIYYFLRNSNISIFTSSRIINIGLALSMIDSVLICSMFVAKRTKKFLTLYLIPVIIFLIASDPYVTFKIFMYKYSVNYRDFLALQRFIEVYSLTLFIGYMIIPFVFLVLYCKHTRLKLLHNNSITSGICLLMIDIFYIYNFIYGMPSMVMPWNVDLNKFPKTPVTYDSRFLTISITVLMGICIIILSIKLKPIGSVKILTKRKANEDLYELNHNLRMIFHIDKNAFYTIEQLASQSLKYYDTNPDIAVENVRHIKSCASKGLSTLTSMLSLLNDVHTMYTKINFNKCIENAKNAINIPADVEFSIIFKNDNIFINAAETHITESFVNIFKNAVESVSIKKSEDKKVTVTVWTENGLAVTEIYDNGIGIEKKNIKRIFSVLYSTKYNNTNWGIGLSYVKKVIDIYNGHIYVDSKPGEYTCFQIILPSIMEDL